MKKFLLILAVLPFVSFGSFVYHDDLSIDRMRLIKWTSYNVTEIPSRAFTVFPYSISDLRSSLMSSTFGLSINTFSSTTQKLIAPAPSSSSFFVHGSSTKANITNSIYAVSNGVGYVVSPMFFPELSSIYYSVVSLYINGYRGSGIVDDFSSSSTHCINVNYPLLLSDVLSSTNSVFRQILLNYLSSISSNVQNINLNVEGLQSAIGVSNEHLDQISDSTQDIQERVDSIHSYTSTIAENSNSLAHLGSIDDNVSSIASFVSSNGVVLSASTNLLSSVTNLLSSSIDVNSSSTNLLSTIGQSLESQTYSMNSQFGEVKEMYANANRVSLDRDTAQLLSSFATQTPLDPSEMPSIGSYDDRLPRDVERLKALQELARRDFNNAINAVRDPDSPFFEQNINDILNNPNSLSQISANNNVGRNFTTNNVLRPLTNSVDESTHKAATNITHKLDDNLQELKDFMNEGVNVRVIYPQAWKDVEAVHVHDDALDVVVNSLSEQTNMLALVVSGLNSHTNSCNFEWQTWLDHFDYWVDGIKFSDLYQLTQNIYSNQYLLFSQYRSFSESGHFWSNFSDNTPEVLTRWGFSASRRNFWEFLSAAQMSGVEFVSFVMDGYSSVSNLVNENTIFSDTDNSSFVSAGKNIISSIPTTTQIEDEISKYTNAVDVAFINTATNFLASTSNRVDSALGVFDGSDNLPSHLVFLSSSDNAQGILAYGVEISLDSLSTAFQVLRVGLAFGYSLVFLILLPKFCLFWIRRFYAVIMSIFGMMRFE